MSSVFRENKLQFIGRAVSAIRQHFNKKRDSARSISFIQNRLKRRSSRFSRFLNRPLNIIIWHILFPRPFNRRAKRRRLAISFRHSRFIGDEFSVLGKHTTLFSVCLALFLFYL